MQPAIRDKTHSTKVGLAMEHMICSRMAGVSQTVSTLWGSLNTLFWQ